MIIDDNILSELWDLLKTEFSEEIMSRQQPIEVTSHVARDFLQNAAYFNAMLKLVWEYVANSLEATKDEMPSK